MASQRDSLSSDCEFEGFSSPVTPSTRATVDYDASSVSSVHTSDLSDFDSEVESDSGGEDHQPQDSSSSETDDDASGSE
jgi:hypothetical protein